MQLNVGKKDLLRCLVPFNVLIGSALTELMHCGIAGFMSVVGPVDAAS
jgi:hypothetical protein